jgi:FtsH-binding integral membrane protein
MYTNLMIVAIVMVAAVVLYIVDRKSKGEPIDFGTLFKLTSFSGIVTGGVVFAVQSDSVAEVVAVATESTQDMFVGKPTF